MLEKTLFGVSERAASLFYVKNYPHGADDNIVDN
jgi:hypothetical protein